MTDLKRGRVLIYIHIEAGAKRVLNGHFDRFAYRGELQAYIYGNRTKVDPAGRLVVRQGLQAHLDLIPSSEGHFDRFSPAVGESSVGAVIYTRVCVNIKLQSTSE